MEISCPKCGSHDLHAGKKGFSGKKAVAGAVLTGGIGVLAGTIGSNKIKITCLKCGNVFSPGENNNDNSPTVKQEPVTLQKMSPATKKTAKIVALIIGILFLFMAITGFASDSIAAGIVLSIIGLFFTLIGISRKKNTTA